MTSSINTSTTDQPGRLPDDSRDNARAWAFIRRVGRTATAFRALGAELHHWCQPSSSDGTDRGVVAYMPTPGAFVAAGEPVAAPVDAIALAEAFVYFAVSCWCSRFWRTSCARHSSASRSSR